ncbi:MAG: PepSY domain-containing protein, partial [Loktanella sp.]|nr:PepSY domain-containing protein [Loktanella sp.]
MTRKLHRWPGLFAAILLIILSISGAALSVFPALDRVSAPAVAQDQTVAALAVMAQRAHPGVEQIKRAPSGKITVWWFEGDTPGSAVFDPMTGQDVGSADPSPVEQWLVSFHRSLFLDDTGRITMGIAAAAMLVLTISGSLLVARRVGGWRNWFAKQRGPKAGRLHTVIARLSMPFLVLTSLTAIWMVASTFELLPTDEASPIFPAQVSSEVGFALADVPTFQTTPVTDLRSLTFPMTGDPTDVYTLSTAHGEGFIDQGNGAMLAWAVPGPWTKVWEWIYLLHTGQGAALWGLILGLVVLSVPFL